MEAPRFAYLAPYYRQAKNVAWDYLKRFTREIDDIRHHETELRCDFPNGARITLYGADFPDRLRGLYFDGIVLDEFAQMEPRIWSEVIRPALADRLGWAVFIGTPRGRNAFWKLYDRARRDKDWFTAIYRASETGLIGGKELAAARKEMSEEEYEQEFECSFEAPLSGSYYGKLMAQVESTQRIREVPWDPALPVTTAWDLGIGDSTAIWFCQQLGAEVRLIDYLECSGVGLDYYAKACRSGLTSMASICCPMTSRSTRWARARAGSRCWPPWASARGCCRSSRWMTASRRCGPCCRAAGSMGRNARAGWKRCATTGAPSTSISAISGRRPCMTGAAMAPTPSAIWRSA